MVNVSKRNLPKKTVEKINRLFYEVNGYFQTRDKFNLFIDELFTPKEKIIIVKRIAIIYLFIKKMDQKTIAKTLNLSIETVSKFALLYLNKETEIIKVIKALIAKEKVLDFMGDMLSVFFHPTIYSTGRFARKLYEKERMKKKTEGL